MWCSLPRVLARMGRWFELGFGRTFRLQSRRNLIWWLAMACETCLHFGWFERFAHACRQEVFQV